MGFKNEHKRNTNSSCTCQLISGLVGAISFGFFISLLGSKRVLLFLTIPSIISWLLIYFGNQYYHILLARFISGWGGGGIQTTVILYTAEIASDNIRGRLGSIMLFLRHVGILVAYIMGATLEYKQIPLICVCIPIIFGIIFSMLPNTPQFFLKKGQLQRAESALKYYKGYKGKTEEEQNAFLSEFERIKAIVNERKVEEKLQLSDFCTKAALKGLGIGFALSIFSQLSANFILITYAVMIFAKVAESVDPYVSSVILAIALILGSLTTTTFADILGRRVLILVSLMGSALGLLSMSLYYYLHVSGYNLSAFSWVPVVSLSFVIFISSSGIVSLSFVCSAENLPTKIRLTGYVIFNVAICLVIFAAVKLFPLLLDVIDLHGCFSILGIGCILATVFVYFVLDETSGQSLDEVGVEDKKRIATNLRC